MAGARKDGQEREAAAAAVPFGRSRGVDPADPFGMAEWMKNLPNVALHPLMAHPTAAVAAATALGFGLSSHIAGMMFGAMQGAASALQKGVVASGQADAAEPVPTAAQPQKTPQKTMRQAREASADIIEARKPRSVGKRAAAPAKGATSDDLKRISGIGPKLEQVLNARGIRRFADLAALSKAGAERLDGELGLGGRLFRDDWIGQAKALTGAQGE